MNKYVINSSTLAKIGNTIRNKSGISESIPIPEIPKHIENIYAAGQKSIVEKLDLLPATVSGSRISVDDVSEIPHAVKCKVESINLLNIPDRNGTISGISYSVSNGAITINGTATAKVAFTLMTLNVTAKNSYALSYVAEDADGNTAESYEGIDIVARYDIDTGSADMPYINENAPVVFTPALSGAGQVRISIAKGTVAENIIIKPILANGEAFMPYTPYVSPESVKVIKHGADESEEYQALTPALDGTVDGMTSVSPHMNVYADTEGVNIEVEYYKSPSTKTYYDKFWDAFQQNGNRTLYQYAFYGSTVGVWNNDNFKPKYPIKPINATQMLTGSGIKGDLTEIVDIDFSMANTVSSALYLNRYITRVGTIDIRNVSESGLGIVNECTALETVDKVILKDDGIQYPVGGVFNFTNCTSLKNIVFEGKITFNINFKSSPLTKESITSVVNALYEGSTGLTATFNKVAKEAAFTENEWTELTATKPNWTFSLI